MAIVYCAVIFGGGVVEVKQTLTVFHCLYSSLDEIS